MKLLDWNKMTTYAPPDYNGSLLLAEWKAGNCSVDPGASATQTNEVATVAIVKAVSLEELLSSELLDTTPEEVAELYLLCQDDAAQAFESYKPKLTLALAAEDADIAWVACAFFYLREKDEIQMGTVNLLTGEVIPGMEHLLKKYPLTSQPQQPQVQASFSLEHGLKIVVGAGWTTRKNDPAALQCLMLQRTTVTTHSPTDIDIERKQTLSEKSALQRVDLPAPHLASTAIIYVPVLLYPVHDQSRSVVYDPTIGRLYLSEVDLQ